MVAIGESSRAASGPTAPTETTTSVGTAPAAGMEEGEEAMSSQRRGEESKNVSNHNGPTVPDLDPKWQGHFSSMFQTHPLHSVGYSKYATIRLDTLSQVVRQIPEHVHLSIYMAQN